ncbi:MAG: chorismate mutase [Nostoc sp.]|uniref:chorismate mutase n=1 Tax=Nostoc sp. TaxID=1180 RepID=UPI002FFB6E33
MDRLTFITHTYQQTNMSATLQEWRVRGLRGATTVSHNSPQAIAEVVDELLNALEVNNPLDPAEIVSVTFSATPDLDAIDLLHKLQIKNPTPPKLRFVSPPRKREGD